MSNCACSLVGYELGESTKVNAGSAFSPSGKLSPKAATFRIGMAKPFSSTLNEQVAWRACASAAAQLTVVEPSGKLAPDSGEQVVLTGAAPSVTVGAE